MKYKQTIIRLTAGVLLVTCLPNLTKAQELTDYSFKKKENKKESQSAAANTDPGGNPDVPIDGGIAFLLAAGAAYGVKKARDYRKNIA